MTEIIQLIRDDHEHFRRAFAQVERAGAAQRAELFQDLVADLARHEAAEEALVHPTLRDQVEGGDAIASEVLEEESRAESVLARMEKMDPASDEFMQAFGELRDDVLAHADHEESEEHPRLEAMLDAERGREMAEAWTRLKDVGPTHPHPHTPQTPEVRAAVGPIAGMFDRARDAARDLLAS